MNFWQVIFAVATGVGCYYIGHYTGFSKAEAKFAAAMMAMTAAIDAITDVLSERDS
jgi:hypothetical protein